MKNIILIILLVFAAGLSSVPPLPIAQNNFIPPPVYPSETFGRQGNTRNIELPQNILALMVEFTDVTFDLQPSFPDSLPHDKAYYERLLFHMSSYWQDASHGQYTLTEDNYTVWHEVITAPNTMGYYGEDGENGQQIELICELVLDVIALVDDDIDFNNYDAIILIHAGAGQETDTTKTEQIYSTFLSRRSLQAGIDPENDDFPGIATNDGIYLKEFSIIPETENQPDIQPGDQLYGMMGVINHNFGHQIGLPTLFDNNPNSPTSYGIGGYGVMGTGVWNANGYVPPLPCAWSRYYLGWEEDIIELDASADGLNLTFPMAKDETTPKLYKLKITEEEYFLIENRQQNPDGSTYVNAEGDTVASFTFATIDNQPVYPPGNLNAGQPRFDFMHNSYLGCEWDFYLPGHGFSSNPADDGSGILIWHIDENVINAKFDPDFEMNQINGDASHKGVDLEQASGIQTLDNNYYGWQSFYGSKDDAFRKKYFINQSGEQDSLNYYFGFRNYNNITWSPTSESYYGGIPLEVFNISTSDSVMTFSVQYAWSLDAGYQGENTLSAFPLDFDLDGNNELFAALPDGKVFLWQNDLQYPGFPIDTNSQLKVSHFPSFDEKSNSVLMQGQLDLSQSTNLFQINASIDGFIRQIFFAAETRWAGPVVINPDQNNFRRAFLALNSTTLQDQARIFVLDDDFNEINCYDFATIIKSNLILNNEHLHFLGSDRTIYTLQLNDSAIITTPIDTANDIDEIYSLQMADIDGDSNADFILSSADSLLYVFKQNGNLFPGFPVEIGLNAISLPSFADVDNNGYTDILIGGENTFAVFDKSGISRKPSEEIINPDSLSLASGVIAADIFGDGILEIIGSFSRQRLCVWKNVNNNDFDLARQYPLTFGKRSLNYPVFADYSDYPASIYLPSNNGVIFRSSLDNSHLPLLHGSLYEYCNLQRTAYWHQEYTPNFDTSGIFIKDETYFYPNPLSNTFSKGIDFGNNVPERTIILRIMTSDNADVTVKIFDIAANRIYESSLYCEKNMIGKLYVDAQKLSSGVYFAVLKAKGQVMKLKFAIEK